MWWWSEGKGNRGGVRADRLGMRGKSKGDGGRRSEEGRLGGSEGKRLRGRE